MTDPTPYEPPMVDEIDTDGNPINTTPGSSGAVGAE